MAAAAAVASASVAAAASASVAAEDFVRVANKPADKAAEDIQLPWEEADNIWVLAEAVAQVEDKRTNLPVAQDNIFPDLKT